MTMSVTIVMSTGFCGIEDIHIIAPNERLEKRARNVLTKALKAKCAYCIGLKKKQGKRNADIGVERDNYRVL